jgi:hypothetical protein
MARARAVRAAMCRMQVDFRNASTGYGKPVNNAPSVVIAGRDPVIQGSRLSSGGPWMPVTSTGTTDETSMAAAQVLTASLSALPALNRAVLEAGR